MVNWVYYMMKNVADFISKKSILFDKDGLCID